MEILYIAGFSVAVVLITIVISLILESTTDFNVDGGRFLIIMFYIIVILDTIIAFL